MPSSPLFPVHIETVDVPVGVMPLPTAQLLANEKVGNVENDALVLPSRSDELDQAFARAHLVLSERGLVGPHRAEAMSILVDWDGPVVGTVDRSLLRIFGFLGVKVHINGIVKTSRGPKIWLARRAANRRASPLHLDTMVAGGQPHGKSAVETAFMEAGEEAGLNCRDLAGLREIKRMDIDYTTSEGRHRERLVIYDLAVSEAFVPRLLDDELCESLLVTPEHLNDLLDGADRFKFNSAVVCRDLVARLGDHSQSNAAPLSA
jgi:8-oxo-dGTP pyrophosphatase MutT (NUDIX family)